MTPRRNTIHFSLKIPSLLAFTQEERSYLRCETTSAMHSRGRKRITCAIRATLLTDFVGLDQEALVSNTSPQHHVYVSQEEGQPLFAEDPALLAFAQEERSYLRCETTSAMHSRGRKRITCAIRATLLTASVGLDQEALVLNTSPHNPTTGKHVIRRLPKLPAHQHSSLW